MYFSEQHAHRSLTHWRQREIAKYIFIFPSKDRGEKNLNVYVEFEEVR